MMVIPKTTTNISLDYSGYIAGSGDGILTVAGKPSERGIFLLNSITLIVEQRITSTKTGNYLFMGLNPNKEYLVIARDYKKEFEPFAWDYVTPADDLTINEQQALWQTWQT